MAKKKRQKMNEHTLAPLGMCALAGAAAVAGFQVARSLRRQQAGDSNHMTDDAGHCTWAVILGTMHQLEGSEGTCHT